MRPWQHAKSSAGKGGDWRTDLPIHEFMDSTKVACPDLRHRMLLHNADLGPELATRAFPNRPEARSIAIRHVTEDLGFTPSLADWLDGCDVTCFPSPLYRRLPLGFDELPQRLARAQGLADDEGPRRVVDLLLLPVQFAGPVALAVLFNSAGPAIVRDVMGGPYEVTGLRGDKAVFDPAYAAEAAIYWVFGTITALPDIVSALRRLPQARVKDP